MEDALMKMARSSELGIKVVDVRIKQINLPVEVSSSIYQRMRAERTAVAREHRSQGREQAEILRADIDRKVTVMIADAESNARQLRGEGDAEAARSMPTATRRTRSSSVSCAAWRPIARASPAATTSWS
jgi:membrane protease subunit HflC